MKDFRDNIHVCVTVSTFLIFMFVDQLLLVDVFSLSSTTGISLTPTKQQWWTSVINIVKLNHDKSIFLPIFTDFHFHLTKIT